MITPRNIVISSVVISALAGLSALLVGVPASWESGRVLFYVPLVATLVYACLHLGAAVLFMTGLKVYKAKLRHAFMAISTAIVALALSTLQLAIIAAFEWWHTPWAEDGFIILPFLLAGFVAYAGARSLARLIGAETKLTKAWVVMPIIVLLSFLTALLPHVHTATAETAFDASNVFITWTVLMYLASLLITLAVKRHMGTHYTQAMAWLATGFAVSCAILAAAVVHSLLVNQGKEQDTGTMIIDLAGIISGFVYLRAGYEFTRTEEV